ncbi:hypothetical protein [Thermogutta sp.]|uniref:hypothetical protein n=1 Tax=Thermogutta sp. TaxID=1962930 RepID=UPI00321FDF40
MKRMLRIDARGAEIAVAFRYHLPPEKLHLAFCMVPVPSRIEVWREGDGWQAVVTYTIPISPGMRSLHIKRPRAVPPPEMPEPTPLPAGQQEVAIARGNWRRVAYNYALALLPQVVLVVIPPRGAEKGKIGFVPMDL